MRWLGVCSPASHVPFLLCVIGAIIIYTIDVLYLKRRLKLQTPGTEKGSYIENYAAEEPWLFPHVFPQAAVREFFQDKAFQFFCIWSRKRSDLGTPITFTEPPSRKTTCTAQVPGCRYRCGVYAKYFVVRGWCGDTKRRVLKKRQQHRRIFSCWLLGPGFFAMLRFLSPCIPRPVPAV